MNIQIGEDLDMILVDWKGNTCYYSKLKTQTPFDPATRLEAKDAQNMYFVTSTDKQLKIIGLQTFTLEIEENTAGYIQARSDAGFAVVAKTAAAASQVLIGPLKGVFANNCNS